MLLRLVSNSRPQVIHLPWPHGETPSEQQDRKSTRLNSSHLVISYAVFCLKKKNTQRVTLSHMRDITARLSRSSCRHAGRVHSVGEVLVANTAQVNADLDPRVHVLPPESAG